MQKKVLSILMALLLIIPLGSVFADEDALATQPPADIASEPTPTPETTPEVSPEVTATPTPDVTPSPTPDATQSPSPDVSPTATPSPTPTIDPSPTPAPSVSPTPTPTPSPAPQGEAQRYIVQFAEPVRSLTASDNIIDTITEKEQIGPADKNMFVMELDENAYQALANDSQVLSIQPDGKSYIQDIPNDQYYDQQWNLSKINMPDAWDIERGSADVVVAVIDTGAGNHADLTQAIVSPYDEVNDSTAFPNYAKDGDSPAWHGTFVAGIIAAQTDNSLGVAGMAPGVSIMPINVFEWDASDNDYTAWDSTIIDAIDYAVKHGADVINMSLGGSNSNPLLLQAISDARAAGVTVIAAAGNAGNDIPMYPASYDGVISVSATDQNDQKAAFSSYGGYVDLSAPGVGIRGLGLSGYLTGQGTSFSAPMVSALAALIKSHEPSLSPDQVESIMEESTVDLGDAGFDYYYGEGRINAYAALAALDNELSVTLIADVPSPQTALNTVLLTADMENGAGYEYYFEAKRNGGDWTVLRDWDAANTCPWIPAVYGEYTLRVSVRPSGGDLASRATLFFTVTAPPWGNPADTAVDVNTGDTAGELTAMGEQDMYRFTASENGTYTIKTSGGTDTYGALFDNNGSLITENDNGTDANFAIETEMTANSVYYIGVRHAGSGTGAYTLSVERRLLPITGVKLSANPTASCEYNSPVYLSAVITSGDTDGAQYEFQVKQDGSGWETVQDFSGQNDCTWTPPAIGAYDIRVYAHNSVPQEDAVDTITSYVGTDIPKQQGADLVAAADSNEYNQPVTLSATTEGDESLTGRAEYRYTYKYGRRWHEIEDWTDNSTCDFTPPRKGTYYFRVYIRTQGRTGRYDTYKTIKYIASDIPKQKSVTLAPDKPPVQEAGTDIILSAQATVNNATLADRAQYLFKYKYGRRWTEVQGWSDDPTCTWVPERKGTYYLRVYTRTEGRSGYDTYDTYKYTVDIQPLESVSLAIDKDSPQEAATEITLTANAEGLHADGTELYLIRAKMGRRWYAISPWSTNNQATWTPSKPGSYTLQVLARAAGRSGYDVVYKAPQPYIVTEIPKQTGVSLTTDIREGQEYGTDVTLTATPAAGVASDRAEYRFIYKYGRRWHEIQDWASSNTCTWQPPRRGTYYIRIYSRTQGRTNRYDAYDTIKSYFADIPKQTSVNLTFDKAPIQESNTDILLTAENTTANETLAGRAEYMFKYKLGRKTEMIRDWSKENTCTWTPVKKGKYILYAYVRTEGRSGYDAYKYYKYYEIDVTPLTNVSLTAEQPSPQKAGTDITLTATAEGLHADNALYRYLYKYGSRWYEIQDWTDSNTCTWKLPEKEYMYTVLVQARADGRSGIDQTATIENYFAYKGKLPVTGLDVDISPDTPQEYNTSIEIKAQATGDSADNTEEYLLRVKRGRRWYTLSPWSTAKDFTWQPSRPGTYTIEVRTRAAGRDGYDAIFTENYTITDIPKQQGVTLTTDLAAPQEYDTPITLTTSADGEASLTDRAQYRFLYKYGRRWHEIQDWTTGGSTCTWTPSKKGTYYLRVYTRTAGRTSSYDTYDTIKYIVSDIPKQPGVLLTTDKKPVQEPDTTINLSALTTATDQELIDRAEYKIQVKLDGTWTTLPYVDEGGQSHEWSDAAARAWTPVTSGQYTLRVYTRTKAKVGEQDGYDTYTDKDFEIDKIPLTGVNLASNPPSPVTPETPVTFTATAEGVYGEEAEYRFTFYNGTSWYTGQNWSTNNTFTEKPSHLCTYQFKVEARSPGSTTTDVSCTIKYRVSDGEYVTYDYSANTMATLQDLYGGAVKSSGGSWVDASQSDILKYVDPDNWMDGQYKYQFLSLNYISGINASDLNTILSDNSQNGGVLNGKGSVFLAAAQQYNINPAYLVSHAMLETGNGTSALATGIVVNGKTVYNIYGIHAYDSNPNYYGSQYAYEQGWTSVDKAIAGGAAWISKYYINRESGEQNTLYAMRWNPNAIQKQIDSGDTTPRPTHQYATDIAWAVKQVDRLKSLMDRCVGAVLEFIIPNYR